MKTHALFIHEEQLDSVRADARNVAETRNPLCNDPDIALAFCGIIYMTRWMAYCKLPSLIQ